VLDAGNGRDALARLEEAGHPIDLILTDVVMPGMSGRDLVERVSARSPGVRVLYMSGYTTDIISNGGWLAPGVSFLQKPFGPEALVQALRQILDGA